MRFILTVLTILLISQTTMAKGIEFFEGTWEEALELARKKEVPIFVDAYAKWCGPCKRMARTVFTDEAVGDFYNKYFINMKIDMETGPGQQFAGKYPVTAFPTLYYINPEGKVLLNTKGGRNADQFIQLGNKALGKNDRSGDYAKAYEGGDRDPELIYKYVKALNKASKSSLKVANDYLFTQKDQLDSEFNLKFILESASEADSRIFDMMIERKTAITAITSKEVVMARIQKACERTLEKAIEFESEDLHKEAKQKMKTHYPANASQFAMVADVEFYRSAANTKKYLKATQVMVKKDIKNDATRLNKLAKDMLKHFPKESKVMSYAEKLASKASDNGGLSSYYLTYARILFNNGKKSAALSTAKIAMEKAKARRVQTGGIEQLIKKIQNS